MLSDASDETLPTANNQGATFHLGWAKTVQYEMETPAPLVDGEKGFAEALSDQRTITQGDNILGSPSVGHTMTKELETVAAEVDRA